ncbi:MAG: hypothetical protein OXG08_11235 [Gammaproteobacteria bacterium]|nr:hypothetical protein [Gammaproteobacteria bacterium]
MINGLFAHKVVLSAIVALLLSTGLLASDIYMQMGAVNWRDVPSIGFPSATASHHPRVLGFYETNSGYEIGVGYSLNERWSLEATYSPAPTITLLMGPAHGISLPEERHAPFGFVQETVLKTHVFSFSPGFELPLPRSTWIFGKLGIVHAQRNAKTSLRTFGPEAFTTSVKNPPFDSSDTHFFLSAGVRRPFLFFSNVSTRMSYQKYFGIGREFNSSLKLDFQYRF